MTYGPNLFAETVSTWIIMGFVEHVSYNLSYILLDFKNMKITHVVYSRASALALVNPSVPLNSVVKQHLVVLQGEHW